MGIVVATERKRQIINGTMGPEVYESDTAAHCWEGIVEEILDHYDPPGIGRCIALTASPPTRLAPTVHKIGR